ncbi:7305_t:CDS:2 [Racocetra persica]|uniref:7305_t:CDS:1 n=1 Tax=Racocetra persica TaxID=160502 RepID=A0ACA9QE97_9GLOM|nr:7305_t:CDS:2 [Racocetra persica]
MAQTGHEIGKVCGNTDDTDEDNEEGGNIVVRKKAAADESAEDVNAEEARNSR